MELIAIIPARLDSTRLPRKVLLEVNGKTILQHVYEQVSKARTVEKVIIATDSDEVFNACRKFTPHVEMTSPAHTCGTERIAEAASRLDARLVLNVQGDEPLIRPEVIDQIGQTMLQTDDLMYSLMVRLHDTIELANPNVPKVIVDKQGYAIYFSRLPIPYCRDQHHIIRGSELLHEEVVYYRHIGIYGFKREFLLKYASLEPSPLEKMEKLEQLRAIENGYRIRMTETDYNSFSIDTAEDFIRLKEFLKEKPLP
ncbi:MAG: 3-deoxy-manno-octulosonate cytidylyltransferase [Bacteroidetes bacterium]|nr:3-deoxy-manno-octulosonate cytidylyltransferase [Bacteroidota bacterium]